MEISTGHHQAIKNHQLAEILNFPKTSVSPVQRLQQEKKTRPQLEQALRCPRCDSTNTKFCYYNNYSLSQPRYFCKGCRRYWTKGGSLRNVPVGGGCRKNKRSPPSTSNSSSSNSKKSAPQDHPTSLLVPSIPLPPLTYEPNDLTLAFSSLHSHDPFFLGNSNPNPNPSSVPTSLAFLDILRGTEVVESSNQNHGGGGLHNFYYEFGGGGDDIRGMLSFDARDNNAIAAPATLVKENADAASLGMEVGRDYWNGVIGSNSSWHGLINSSLL